MHEEYMRQALDLARQAAACGEVPVGCVIVHEGEIIAKAHNQRETLQDPTAHAEIAALRDACSREKNYRLPGATLYVTIEPCAMCAGAIVHARIARVVFGAVEPKAGAVISTQHFFEAPQLNHKVAFDGGCMAAECSQAISGFFQSRREQQKKLKHRLRGEPGDASASDGERC